MELRNSITTSLPTYTLTPSLQHTCQPPLHPTGLWTKADSSTNTIGFMYWTLQTSESKSSSINMTISCPDIMDRTKPYSSFDETTYGPTSTPLSSNSAAHARLAGESKQGIFIPTVNEITAQHLANLFILHIFSKHGVPSHITCDRGSEFISCFFRSLGQALDRKSVV